MTICSCRWALVCLSLALMLLPATRAAEIAPPAPSPATTEAENASRAQFIQLSEYLREDALDFTTSYVSQNRSLGTSRGSAHFVIGRANLLRVEITAPNFSYLLVSDGDVLTICNQIISKYTQVLAPRRPLGALMLFTGLAAFEAQVLQFLGVISDVASGRLGIQVSNDSPGTVAEKQCNHFEIGYSSKVFRDKWEAWLARGGVPLPCKSQITSADDWLIQTNTYVWNPSPTLAPGAFALTPPKGSQKVDLGGLGLASPH